MSEQPNRNGGNEAHLKRVFAYISKYIPALKKKKLEMKQKAFVDGVNRKAHEPIPCGVCCAAFDPFNGEFQEKHKYCESCRKNLEEGYTALVTIGPDASGKKRFAFTKFPEASDSQRSAVAGKVMVVSNGQMDMIANNKNANN